MSFVTTTVDPRRPDAALAEIAERDQARYRQMYVPVEDDAIASLNDRSIINRAQANAERGFDRAPGRILRDLSRYGVRLGKEDIEAGKVGFEMERALGTADVVNNARLDQFDRNRTLRNELINVGRGFSSDANGMLTEAAGLKTNRDNNNRAAAAQRKASYISTAGSLASTALFAALVGL